MANQNGQLILQILQNFDEPATVTKIVSHIAGIAKVRPSVIKESVEETLKAGVRYGFVQYKNRKYFTAPVQLDGIQSAEGNEPSDEDDETEDMKDRSPRGRKGRGGSRRTRSRRNSRK